jgi:hypothetical protein
VLNESFCVDQEDAVVDVLEHTRVLLESEPLLLDLPLEPPHVDRALERGDEVLAVDRLLHEVVRAAAQRLHREVVLAVAVIRSVGVPGRTLPISASSASPSMTGILMSLTIAS